MTDTVIRPELANKIKLVADARSMDVETFIETAIDIYVRQLEKEDLQKNISTFEQLLPELQVEYGDQFVAITNEKVVDNDVHFEVLHKRVRASYGRKPVLIRKVSTGERTLNFHSTMRE